MPQFDFRQAFFGSTESNGAMGDGSENGQQQTSERKRASERMVTATLGFSRSQWINIAFVACACLGGVICALYVFNGTELLQAAAGWPSEFLYHRPELIPEQVRHQHLMREKSLPAATPRSAVNDSGDPFSRSRPFLSYNASRIPLSRTTNGPSTANASPSASSLLQQLNLLPPGGDALSRALNQGAADLARTKTEAGHTVTVAMKAPRSQTTQATPEQTRNRIKGEKQNGADGPDRRDVQVIIQKSPNHMPNLKGHPANSVSSSARPSVNLIPPGPQMGGVRAGPPGVSGLGSGIRGR